MIIHLARPFAWVFFRLKFGYRYASAPKLKTPFIVLCNHTTDFDPIMVGLAVPRQMYYIVSEHVFRRGFLSKLLKWGVSPIPRTKGSTDAVAAMNVLRLIKRGENICIFAEGERSWNGATAEVHATTARLVRASRASLITYKLAGGYLTSPRWSASLRHGRVTGRCTGVYTPEDIAGMSDAELDSVIRRGLSENAYDTQRAEMVRYRGKRLAEALESALYVCPRCHGISTLRSEGDRFRCSCGLDVKYTEYGFFEGQECPFDNVLDWDAWQTQFLRDCRFTASEPIFTDADQTLWQISDEHGEERVADGALALYADKLELGPFTAPIAELEGITQYGRTAVVFSHGGKNYEIRPNSLKCGRKYVTMANILKEA